MRNRTSRPTNTERRGDRHRGHRTPSRASAARRGSRAIANPADEATSVPAGRRSRRRGASSALPVGARAGPRVAVVRGSGARRARVDRHGRRRARRPKRPEERQDERREEERQDERRQDQVESLRCQPARRTPFHRRRVPVTHPVLGWRASFGPDYDSVPGSEIVPVRSGREEAKVDAAEGHIRTHHGARVGRPGGVRVARGTGALRRHRSGPRPRRERGAARAAAHDRHAARRAA